MLVNNDAEAETAVRFGADETLTKSDLTHPLLQKIINATIKQKKLETALTESEAQRKAIISNITDGIIICDESFRILFANPAAEKLLNQTAENLRGTRLPVHQSKNNQTTLTIHPKSTNPKQVEIALTETIWEGNLAYLASFRDDSSQAEIRNQLSQKNISLEHRNYELDQFNSTMAHQVQGLLGQIIGYASLLEMHHEFQLDEEAKLMLNRINQSSHKMNNVINELMLLSSIDHGEVDIIPLDMERILIEVFKRLRFQLDKYNGRIRQPHSWPIALGQPSWIEEVWVNYITNGLKYGGDPPQLELGATPLNNGMIRFWVRDNGIGISPQDQKRLFKPHTRLKQLKVRGEGLGLSIVKRIVHKCGGEVGVISELGAGSTFWFTLKAAPDSPEK
ncbi:MAG: PAS domain-containing protein [Candidatus Thermofonsia bacterium]|nr:MAG: PAS domain-containing protein [Candidatus Thermofonsia bacterium]